MSMDQRHGPRTLNPLPSESGTPGGQDAVVGDSASAVERAARTSYGRLVSFLASEGWDLTAAEDALADALVAALESWPRRGVPRSPDAWLLTAAKRRLIDAARHRSAAERALPLLANIAVEEGTGIETLHEQTPQRPVIPERRLELMFMCAHPAIAPAARTPLMLQTVLGLEARTIAAAFLVSPEAMSQRLVRAKAKIREAGVPMVRPTDAELPERLEAVLQAVYAAFGAAYDDAAGVDPTIRGLADRAGALATVLADLMPQEPEPSALLALILHCEARRPARRRGGVYVPLGEQDCGLWSVSMIDEAERRLEHAARLVREGRHAGRFGLEAAIQSAHAVRRHGVSVPWSAIVSLYDALLSLEPEHEQWTGARVARAVAVGEVFGPGASLDALKGVAAVSQTYQPYWASLAEALWRAGRPAEAREALDRSIGLAGDMAVRDFLQAKGTRWAGEGHGP